MFFTFVLNLLFLIVFAFLAKNKVIFKIEKAPILFVDIVLGLFLGSLLVKF